MGSRRYPSLSTTSVPIVLCFDAHCHFSLLSETLWWFYFLINFTFSFCDNSADLSGPSDKVNIADFISVEHHGLEIFFLFLAAG